MVAMAVLAFHPLLLVLLFLVVEAVVVVAMMTLVLEEPLLLVAEMVDATLSIPVLVSLAQ
jgi:hypothetical protein